ncbi:uncharacterized protein K460DRAFT_338880 [Cucurbitaria berberidis CBS 394.84]|uniref:Zn(2)-C6 fungal-type domain-containing protein n=1 Tax=Cucurbitaria berberidis CBS 394.84 TaxID=1168544 RepID=A0A9P4GID9_9PLEO|nr:uncharacterized protein K460DRAFT_338880 [Cucurbitaria berberidis CBS 394.84]KAF1846029.1 hypothetical protein K460DRAFT_338880 [Cucurbitaria berberidis CBS 394.84]
MPNVGRPSKGCKHCRDRKVKCDLKRPACSQCIRAGKKCYGYRDALSMMFKNESDVVAKKAEKRYEELAKSKVPKVPKTKGQQTLNSDSPDWLTHTKRPSNVPRSSTHLIPWSRYSTPESMTMEILPSIEEQAQGFFISNYVAQPSIVPRGQYEWITELLAQPNTEEILRGSVNAVSLAGLANATKSLAIMHKAQVAYVNALQVTNSALRVKETAVKDSTLISVILLGTYENLVSNSQRSIQAWAKHVVGACTLLNLRGKEQFETSIGRRVFHQFYGVVLLVSLKTGTPIHHRIQDLYKALAPTSNYDIQGRIFTTKMVSVMSDSIDLNHDKLSDPVIMVNRALIIDREIDEVTALMPTIWHYETVFLKNPSKHLYGDSYHVYADPWIAQMWNNLRTCRMSLYKTLLKNLARGCEQYNPPLFSPDEIKLRKEATEAVMRDTAAAIIASVPQITAMIPFPDPTSPKRKDPATLDLDRQELQYTLHTPGTFIHRAQATGMIHLIWPLFAAGQSDLSSYEIRQWCIDMLLYIALRIGTRQAVVLAEDLKEIQRTGS